MKLLRCLAAALTALLSGLANAEPPPPHRGPPPIAAAVARLNLDAPRAEQVIAILEQSRGKARAAREQIGRPTDETTRATLHAALQAIRTDTNQQLAAVLDAEEMARLKDAMPRPFGPRGRGKPI